MHKRPPAFKQSKTVDGVKVTVQADEGVFPEGATLEVKKASAKVEKKVEAAVEEAGDTTREVAASYTFDIKVMDADGTEVQPADDAKVKVSFKTDEVAEDLLTTEIFHIDGKTGEAESMDVKEKGKVATAETDEFSTYTVVFSYEGLTYTMPEDTVALDKVMEAIKLQGKVYNVTSSDTTKLTASGLPKPRAMQATGRSPL